MWVYNEQLIYVFKNDESYRNNKHIYFLDN